MFNNSAFKGADVQEQYRKFPEIRRSDVIKIQEWCQQQPHLPNIFEIEAFFFLHACYNSVEKAKVTIDICYTSRTHSPEFFSGRDIKHKSLIDISEVMALTALPKTTPEGYKVLIAKLADPDPSKYNYADTLKLTCMLCDMWFCKEGAYNGVVIIFDVEGFSFAHLTRIGLIPTKKFLYYMQEGAAIRLKTFHYINTNPILDKLLAFIKPFIKKELHELINIHTNLEKLYKFVPKEILPTEYGGLEESVNSSFAKQYAEALEHREFFLEEEKIRRVNENLRPGKPKTENEVFGVAGNFRKLDFD